MSSIKYRMGSMLLVVGAGYLLAFAPCAFAASPALDCKHLASMKLPQTTIVSAELVEAGTFKTPSGDPLPDLQAFCRVAGIAKPSSDSDIKFEVWLPAAGWNGRLWGASNGGFAGLMPYESLGGGSLGGGLAEGYVAVGTDTGHEGDVTDASWAIGHPEKVIDYGYRAIHEVTVRAKAILSAFYGRKATYSYFTGGSNGGRQALIEAQRYPDDYDGIIAGAPDIDYTHVFAGMASIDFVWFGKKAGYFPPSKLPAIQAAALAACDSLDGIKDGVIDDPRRCTFDPSVLLCQGPETDKCLTPPQLAALRTIYAGQVLPGGARVHGYSPGAETGSGGWSWDGWITSSPQAESNFHKFALGYFGDLVFGDPKWDFHTFDPDRDIRVADQKLSPIMNATDPDLKKFVAHGGKLILYHGWDDQVIPPLATVDYYERVRDTIGQKATADAVRLFMVPGMMHVYGGPGPNSFGQFAAGAGDPNMKIGAALQRWVEEGTAPERIIATKRKNDPPNEVVRTRPLCAFPNVAHYRGTGSTDDAASFDCAAPPKP